ncbi:MAG: 2Fe-2S iron-sulfur cluster-binding protein [Thermoanaerobaculales bacterium]|nr:2Fe-2S iron-sulfur cluster-binding protein [Thermoanaerobaculales bacterium]
MGSRAGDLEASVDLSEFKTETATVRCEPSGREAVVVQGSNLMDVIHQIGLGLGQSCDGIALCGFCRVEILQGIENLSPRGEEEQKLLASMHADDDERMACCAAVHGDVTLTTSYW